MRRVVLVALLASSGVADADSSSSIHVTLNANGQQLANYLKLSVPELIANAEGKFNDLFQTARLPELLSAFASTTAIADRGLGVSYAVVPGSIMIGAVANGAISTDASLGDASHIVGGFVFNFGAMAGANLGRWDHPRWSVFANGFYESASYHSLDGHLTTGGAHVQYRVVAPPKRSDAQWIGVDITTGLELAKWEVNAAQNMLPINFKVDNPQGDSEHLTLNGAGTMDVVATAVTVPVEVTTGVRLGNVITLYGGGGIDLTSATATIDVALAGDMVIRSNQETVGTATIDANGSASPSAVSVHTLAGVQLDVPHVQIYVQGLLTPDAEGVALGFRLAL
jgi:hypothetical protein